MPFVAIIGSSHLLYAFFNFAQILFSNKNICYTHADGFQMKLMNLNFFDEISQNFLEPYNNHNLTKILQTAKTFFNLQQSIKLSMDHRLLFIINGDGTCNPRGY